MNWLRRLYARHRVARRFKTGRYVFRGSRGQLLAKGRVRSRLFSIELEPAHVHRSGIVKRLEMWNRDGELALQHEIAQPFMVSRKSTFTGKRVAFP